MRKTRAKPRRLTTHYPVLLVHGLGLRDDLPLLRYWGRIPGELRRQGVSVHLCQHDAWACVEENSLRLKERIEQILKSEGCKKVNLIAHSKGGIESRRAVHLFSGHPPIASITTIATPHQGASLAGWLLKYKPLRYDMVKGAVNLFGKVIGDKNPDSLMALNQLTPAYMSDFNLAHPDHPDVFYQSVACQLKRPVLDPLFVISHKILLDLDGENDGVVGVAGCQWGKKFMIWGREKGLSHLDISDMFGLNRRGFDILAAYKELLRSLKRSGL